MTEKRFLRGFQSIHDTKELEELIDRLDYLKKENTQLKGLLTLIADAFTDNEYDSTKEIIRETIRSIDTITDESANAWNDYVILSKFFNEYYGEHWDNYD